MLKEWLENYNPFNSMKCLAQRSDLEKVASGVITTPVSVYVDPTNICNVNCFWCKWSGMRKENTGSIPDDILLALPAFLKTWGVKSVCVGGGGEPLIHPKINEFLESLKENGLQVGLMTNGVLLAKEDIRATVLDTCAWVGFSVDAATAEIYGKIKHPRTANAFSKVIDNVTWICKARNGKRNPRVTLKFLVHHANYAEIYAFIRMAKICGADDALLRPVFIPDYRFTKGVRKTTEFYLREARKDFEDENFKVYGIVHKFDKDWLRAIRFKRCRATPLVGCFMANGTYSICCDRRGDKEANLGEYYPFDKFIARYGGEEHRKLIDKISPPACPKCSQSITNEVIEKVIIEDEMTLDFI